MRITLQPPTHPARLTTPNKGWIINKNTDRAAQTPQWRPGDSPGWNVINLMARYLPESSSERLAPGDDTGVTVWIRYQDNSCSAQPSTGALATLSVTTELWAHIWWQLYHRPCHSAPSLPTDCLAQHHSRPGFILIIQHSCLLYIAPGPWIILLPELCVMSLSVSQSISSDNSKPD